MNAVTELTATTTAVLNISASQLEDKVRRVLHWSSSAYLIHTARSQRKSRRVLSRIGTPEDIANLVSFLVSERASYITGQSVCVLTF